MEMALMLSLGIWTLLMGLLVHGQGGLKTGFYSSTCPNAEATVRSTVEAQFKRDPTIAPGLLRLHFHDCFVQSPNYTIPLWLVCIPINRTTLDTKEDCDNLEDNNPSTNFRQWIQGCDGSVLISGSSAERNALPNLGLRGFEVIDDAKTQLESLCPGVVSCADILAVAARDAVDLSNGPSWSVPTGRRDGRISLSSEVTNLPSPLDSITVQRQKFADKGLNDQDLVTLVGAHTIGQTDCQFFRYRLYNFTTTGNADPTINQVYLGQLQALCPPNGDGSKRVALDKDSQSNFDVSFFKNVRDGNGVLESDQRLWGDSATNSIVQNYAGTIRGLLGLRFNLEFPKSMIKMSSIGVKTGTQGEIRKVCSKFN